MGKPKQYIEPAKNIILVVLFFTTVLLLYFFWGNPISNSFRITNIIGAEPSETPSYQMVTQPDRIDVHFGGGSYTVLEEKDVNAWEQCLQVLRDLDSKEIQTLEEITTEQFDRIMEFQSILYRFYYDMPLELFLRQYGLQEIPGADQVGEFSLIGFSSGSPESLFVYSSSKNKYFRIVYGQPHASMNELLSNVEGMANVSYYRIGDLVGRDNRTLIPLSLSTSLEEVAYSPEFKDLNTAEVKAFAQTFFGESFDFVRKIEESKGTHVYMYGYGEKILTISAEGRVEYKNKETPQGSQQNYFEALDSAMQFVAVHGGWQTNDGVEMSPVIHFARAIENEKRKGYRFVFRMQMLDESLYLEGSHSIMVEVIHGQVTQYIRDMIEVEAEDLQEQIDHGTERQTFTAINMIAQNYQYIASVLSEKGYDFSDLTGEALFDAVSDLILAVTAGYMKPENGQEGGNVLIPAWVVKADDVLIYFDLYDARPLGHTGLLGS